MSAAAILSVAARKAASEGKKVGAAALTLIALVVMSLTVFPSLNRAPSDQMAEAPASSGSSQETAQDSSASGSETADAASEADATGSTTEESVSPTPALSEKDDIKAVMESPSVGAIINSDSRSKVFAIDEVYTALGDNGLKATFTFNPSSDQVFSDVLVEINVDGYVFEFEPANVELGAGMNTENRQVYMLVGDATELEDEFGQKWSKSELGKSRVVIQIVMQPNGTTVQSVNLALYAS
jgi:hypothetical protein